MRFLTAAVVILTCSVYERLILRTKAYFGPSKNWQNASTSLSFSLNVLRAVINLIKPYRLFSNFQLSFVTFVVL